MSMNKETETKTQAGIPNSPIRFLFYISRPHIRWVILSTLAVIMAAGLSQSSNIFFKWITDAVESGDKAAALRFGLLYPVVLLSVQLLYRLSGWMGISWIAKVQKETSDTLFNYVSRQSHGYFVNRFAGSLLNKIGNVVGAMDSLISSYLWSVVNAFVSFVVTFFFMYRIDPLSSGYFVILVVVLLTINQRWTKEKRRLSKANAEAGSKLRGTIVDVLSNITATRQYVRIEEEQARQAELSDEWVRRRRKNWMFSERVLFFNSLILAVFGMAIFYSLVQRWSTDAISTGDFLFVVALMSSLSGTLVFMARTMTDLARAVGEAEEGLEEALQPYEIVDISSAQPLRVQAGVIAFDTVHFLYDENAIFSDFSATITAGERVGLVGQSGAGKTTLISLLLRQHDIQGGAILIDGQNIAEVTQDSLRANISVVPQEPLLFHRTIRENIAYGNPHATEAEIVEAAKKAQAHAFIEALPEKYDTLVGERGVKLSGGQKQRVAIARAILKDAPILILDEATSALDSESEVEIQKALRELMEGKTVIAVAHRLSTLREMDRILVLEAGKIVEDGTHDTLAQNGGVYQRLWEHQAGGFLQE